METIYQIKYLNDTLEQCKEAALAAEPELKKALSTLPDPIPEDFSILACLCNQLAAQEDAELLLEINREEQIGTIHLHAPCFLFQIRQLALLEKITALSSEIIFDVTEEKSSLLTVHFTFSKTNDKLLPLFKEKISKK